MRKKRKLIRDIKPAEQFYVYRSCITKTRYDTRKAARTARRFVYKKYGTKTRIYSCKYCDGFHLATKNSESSL